MPKLEWKYKNFLERKCTVTQVSNIRRTLVGNKIVDHSLRCSWSIACRRCSNYIFILNLALGFIGLGKDNCKTRWGTIKFGDLVPLILEILRHLKMSSAKWQPICSGLDMLMGILISFVSPFTALQHLVTDVLVWAQKIWQKRKFADVFSQHMNVIAIMWYGVDPLKPNPLTHLKSIKFLYHGSDNIVILVGLCIECHSY